jgi:long-chain acyl-CoA synthetase
MIASVPRTVAALPFFASGRYPKAELVGWCRAEGVVSQSAREFVARVRDVGLGLDAIGLAAGTRVVLLSESRPDWLIADFATLANGGVTVPVYPTLSADQVAFILRDSGATMAFVSTAAQLEKLAAAAPGTALGTVVAMDEPPAGLGALPFELLTLTALAARGHQRILDGWGVGRNFHDTATRVAPDDLATIIYTSGTTGEPKGVMLTHANLVSNIAGVVEVLSLGPDDRALSFLPLCHGFERMVAYVYLTTGVSMVFAESIDTVPRDLQLVQPTVMTGVPRVFEKLHARVLARGREASGLKRRIFDWAVGVAERRGRALATGRRQPAPGLALQARLAERLVFEKVRAGVGGRLRFAVSGSAPLRADVGEFFLGMGLPIVEGYGLTETAPVLTVMPLERIRFGTVGRALPNVELRIAPDGEILARGPNVMMGYYNRPADTEAALAGGWFHTGDIGALDGEGYLSITDRKKELLVTSGGKKVAPQPIEGALRAHRLIAEVVLLGEGRHFPAALVVPDVTALAQEIGADAAAIGRELGVVLARPDVRAHFAAAIDAVNAGLAQFERIKKFTLLDREFTIADGELTPTLKVKRRVIEQKYRRVIDEMYGS